MKKIVVIAKNQASKVRGLPIPLGLAVCALISYAGIWAFA